MANQIKSQPAVGDAGDPRFRRLLEKFPAAAYTCDVEGLITSFNQPAVELWGREPKLNHPDDRYCGSHKLYSSDGAPILHERCWMALALQSRQEFNRQEIVIERPDGTRRTALAHANPIFDDSGRLTGAVNVLVDISERIIAEEEVRRLNHDLEERVRQRTADLEATARELRHALDQIKTLRGLVPICSWCKRIRDDTGFWQQLEFYLHSHTEAEFTHGICPDCSMKNYQRARRHKLRS
jgi:hypothetical protein